MITPPTFDLDEPGTIAFTAERAFRGRHLTAFCLSLREEKNRNLFIADQSKYMDSYDLAESDRRLVVDRNWTGLLLRGAHLQAVSKLAATVGGNLYDISSHTIGVPRRELIEACPRSVSRLPGNSR